MKKNIYFGYQFVVRFCLYIFGYCAIDLVFFTRPLTSILDKIKFCVGDLSTDPQDAIYELKVQIKGDIRPDFKPACREGYGQFPNI